MKKRNKAYRPRPVNPDALNWAIAGAHTLPLAKQRELTGYVDVSIDRFRTGTANREDWNTLANGMNIAEALAYFDIGPNLMPHIQAALDALHDVAMRMLSTGSSTLRSSELAAIREGRDLYAIQLSLCSQAEAMRAVSRVNDLHRSGAMKNVAKLYHGMAYPVEA